MRDESGKMLACERHEVRHTKTPSLTRRPEGTELYHFRLKMMQWQNGFLGVSKAAALGWARGPGKRSERRSRL